MITERVPLDVGDEAWCLVSEPVGRSEERSTLIGAARVRVTAIDGEAYTVDVLLASGGRVLVGRPLTMSRVELYARKSREEHEAFGTEVGRFWGPR